MNIRGSPRGRCLDITIAKLPRSENAVPGASKSCDVLRVTCKKSEDSAYAGVLESRTLVGIGCRSDHGSDIVNQ